ncbi:MAG: DUF2946 domain-containing protein [Rhizobiales bacterium]|nr:DUF2946 domain-containing protein [Hyphomicrobiales bacterium]
MFWLRSKAKSLSFVALFALALQLGLSFGHVHADRALAGKTAVAGLLSSTSSDSGNDTDNRADLCAVCVTIAIANALIDSAPPVLPLPVVTTASDILPVAVASGASTTALGFQSRAPPIA